MKELRRSQQSLIAIHSLKIILALFTSTFLTSYIVSLNPDNIMGEGIFNIGLLYISQHFVYIVVYFLLSYLVSRSNRVLFLRIGIFVNCLLLIAIVFFGQSIAKWILLTGALCGISEAFYNSSYLVMKNEFVPIKTINSFNIVTLIATNLINVIVPTLLGLLIDISTYSHIAIYVVAISVVQFIISFLIKSRTTASSSFQLKQFLKYLKEDKFARSKIKYSYWNAFFAGFKNTYKVLIVILTIYTFKTNLSLGIFTSIFSITTMLLLMLYKKFEYHAKLNKLALYLTISILPVISCLLFILFPSKAILIILNLFLTIAIYLSEYGSNCERDAIIKNLNQHKFISEHQFVTEFFMCVSRIFSYGIFIIVGLFANIILFELLLIILIGLTPIKFLIMHKQTKIRKELESLNSDKQNQDDLSINNKTT